MIWSVKVDGLHCLLSKQSFLLTDVGLFKKLFSMQVVNTELFSFLGGVVICEGEPRAKKR